MHADDDFALETNELKKLRKLELKLISGLLLIR